MLFSPTGSISTPVSVSNGGTGAATLTSNNVILGNGTSAVQFVAPGTNGNILTSNGTTWQSSTPTGVGTLTSTTSTITAVTTNPTKGTVAQDLVSYMTIGKLLYIHFDYAQTGAGSSGSGTYKFLVPGGFTIDSTYIRISTSENETGNVGHFVHYLNTTGYVKAYDTTHLAFWSSAVGGLIGGTTQGDLSSATMRYSFTAVVPIV